MANKHLFTLLFCAFSLVSAYTFASNTPVRLHDIEISLDACTAPPPDSFRITDAGPSHISLGWIPKWVGADHHLSIFRENLSGGWDFLYSIPGGLVDSYTFSNLEFNTKYRFKIATKCSGGLGEPSELVSIVDGVTLILDLVLDGRTPINPDQLSGCPTINYQDHNWVGFKIERNGGTTSTVNFFEFGVEGLNTPQIKRDLTDSKIVAGNFQYKYPNFPSPLKVTINNSTTFRVFLLKGENSYTNIGFVDVNFDDVNHTIQFCQSPIDIWNNNYSFRVLTAEEAIGLDSSEIFNRYNVFSHYPEGIIAQNPFSETLNLFLPKIDTEISLVNVVLITSSGQTVLEQKIIPSTNNISINTSSLISGFYILRVETPQTIQILKVLKTN